MKQTVLILDDEQSICESLYFALQSEYEVEYCTEPDQGLRKLKNRSYDVLLLDMRLGNRSGMDLLRSMQEVKLDTAVIIMTAYGSEKSHAEAMRLGAFAFLSKPLDLDELKIMILKALEYRRMSEDVRYLSDELQSQTDTYQMIGESRAIRHVYQLISKLKDVDSSVLVTGESGTGKELVARAIHSQGKRRNGRFVAVNCAAIPENLLESEFFGHKKGAFTGAVSDQRGKFLLADRGTIFLDEIGDMPASLQVKLLRVLQEREIIPVGDSKSISIDVRVIAATNRNLPQMVKEGKFREDLYYRLRVMEVHMPPLRERQEDIIPLCNHFIKRFNSEQKKNIQGISSTAQRKLLSYHYPGNIRQLANIIEHATILTAGKVIDDLSLPEELDMTAAVDEGDQLSKLLAGKSMKELERAAIVATLAQFEGNKVKAAQSLGISERTLWNKLKEYDLR